MITIHQALIDEFKWCQLKRCRAKLTCDVCEELIRVGDMFRDCRPTGRIAHEDCVFNVNRRED